MEFLTNGGLHMPKLGLGTWGMKGAECRAAVEGALTLGYRHIDTAQMYGNEDAVGEALAANIVSRDKLHVTTKVWWENLAPDAMRRAMENSLRQLKTDYVDLYLIHWPAPDMNLPQALETLIKLKEEGYARVIGVSNFTVALLKRTIEEVKAPIAVNQIEYHVQLDQTPVLTYARSKGVAVTAYCPLGRGGLGDNKILADIAKKHGATAAQVALKWLIEQDGVAAIPKAAKPENQKANLAAEKIALDDADRAAIAKLPKQERLVKPVFAPAWDVAA
jgi:2,5-diketo-D-gluconate reductase B